MNTTQLKRFAQDARRKLLEQVAGKLNFVKKADTSELRGKTDTLNKLNSEISKHGEDAVIDKVAYTWFNRLVALRFMDANEYQPIGMSVVSPGTIGNVSPEILSEAHRGNISPELKVDRSGVMNILNGTQPANNPDNVAYRVLLVAACNHLSNLFPFLFERIDDYTELLLPDDLTSPFSIVTDVYEGMSDEDCKEVEIIGWLYQFYISDRKDEVFAEKGRVKKEDIPAATQLFTPRWIVEYMVQNTVGKLWMQNNPRSSLRDKMPYYIETDASKSDDYLKINSPEELTLLDQTCGSGHILVYGFELFYHIYEEVGYQPSQIPELIIQNNLFGYEIDERAAQLASFSVLMKARSYHRRLFRNSVQPNILCYKDLSLSEAEIENAFELLNQKLTDELKSDLILMQQATNLGSLIQPKTSRKELEALEKLLAEKQNSSDVFHQKLFTELYMAVVQLRQLSQKFCCVVQNPPYMSGGKMNKELSDFVKKNYPDSKADLMACFMESGLAALHIDGILGMINQQSWMFLSSYENLRDKLIKQTQFDTLLHLGPRTFPEIGGEVVQNAAFTFINREPDSKSSYIRLIDYKDSITKSEKTLEAIQNPNCGWFYTKSQKDFEKIPGWNIGYWASDNTIKAYNNSTLSSSYLFRRGLGTGDNNRFLRFWHELNNISDYWAAYNKGGDYRKWYGNREYKVYWENNGYDIKNFFTSDGKTLRSRPQNLQYNFRENISYSSLTSGKPSFRIFKGFINDQAGNYIVPKKDESLKSLMGLMNTKIGEHFISIKNQTLNITADDINSIPILQINRTSIVNELVEGSTQEWDSRETSWDFQQNELIRLNGQDIEEAVELYKQYWTKQFYQLHQNEEELNKEFIHIYGLAEELDPDVALEDITILRDELQQSELKVLSAHYRSGWQLNSESKWELPERAAYPELPFDEKELVMQFISYAVGCMFGRYSIDKEGLILANQGEGIDDFFEEVGSKETLRFIPDEDGIIPVLDEEWFADDIVEKFNSFLKASFGEENFSKNLRFVEESLGKDIRGYFTRNFYNDHIKRYKKRPIYWMFSSPKGYFNVLIYMHRYTRDTVSRILNSYLREFIDKLEWQRKHQEQIEVSGSTVEQNRARKEIDRIDIMLNDCKEYEQEILFPLATEHVEIDLDDGVLVNYNKMGSAVAKVAGLNDKDAKKKVRKFDWIDTSLIRD